MHSGVFANKEIDDGDEEFFLMIKSQYKKAFTCVMKVYDYIKKDYGLELTNDEMMYLTVHIHRITMSKYKIFLYIYFKEEEEIL